MPASPENRQAGFTLVEMVVVLAIATLVFSVGAMSLAVLKGRATPMRSAQEVAQLMNATHLEAINGPPQSVSIDLALKRVSARGGERVVTIPENYMVSVLVGRETVVDDTAPEIHFLPDGTSSGAEIVISGPNGDKARVDTNWLTGLSKAVHVSR